MTKSPLYKPIFGLLLCQFLMVSTLSISAQTYFTTAGLRLGNSIGLTINQRVLRKVTVEAILQNDFKQTTYLHLLAKKHNSIITRRANFYIGAGVHMGVQQGEGGVAGFDGILGLEMTAFRLNFSGDLKPQLTTGEGLRLNGAVSIRYVFVKDKFFKRWEAKRKRKKRKRQRQKANGRKL